MAAAAAAAAEPPLPLSSTEVPSSAVMLATMAAAAAAAAVSSATLCFAFAAAITSSVLRCHVAFATSTASVCSPMRSLEPSSNSSSASASNATAFASLAHDAERHAFASVETSSFTDASKSRLAEAFVTDASSSASSLPHFFSRVEVHEALKPADTPASSADSRRRVPAPELVLVPSTTRPVVFITLRNAVDASVQRVLKGRRPSER
mmetsp:Transcript_5102/g.11242  ORF Transcript_5102/g.11242 Transcript_5102/m.11242 type:complete len:207 (+) Transcript_5102:107-727(+)